MKCNQCGGTMRDTGNTISFQGFGTDHPIWKCKKCEWPGLLISGAIVEIENAQGDNHG
jgi:hypothetical protein